MKPWNLLAVVGITVTAVCGGAEPPAFTQADLMRIGVYYYPEAWPSNQWARRVSVTHMARKGL